MMRDDSYTTEFWDWDIEERTKRMHDYQFCINENEVMFDAADCELIGDMMFVQQSMVTNLAGIRWLKRHFEPKGIQVHTMHFPYDLFPSHTDCTFVAVRPGLVLTNPDRPFVDEEGETPLINFLEQEHGFDVLGIPYRQVFEFGGSLHCSTWDIRRRGDMKNYFPNREGITDVGLLNHTDLP